MLKFKIMIVPFLIIMLTLTSCTVISVIPIGEGNSGLSQNKVHIYATRGSIIQEFEEIAVITAKVDEAFGPGDDTLTMNKILSKAQEIGADAVIFEETDYATIRVTAIKYTD